MSGVVELTPQERHVLECQRDRLMGLQKRQWDRVRAAEVRSREAQQEEEHERVLADELGFALRRVGAMLCGTNPAAVGLVERGLL